MSAEISGRQSLLQMARDNQLPMPEAAPELAASLSAEQQERLENAFRFMATTSMHYGKEATGNLNPASMPGPGPMNMGAPGMMGPGMRGPGMRPGMMMPGMGAPGMVPPMGTPGMGAPGMGMPGMSTVGMTPEQHERAQRLKAVQLLGRVYVGGIPFDAGEQEIAEAFRPFGA